jgi:Family of unknown function (DUF6159)
MFGRGWELTTKSWQLVRGDARLLVFPSLSALLGLAGGMGVFLVAHGRAWWIYLAVFAAFIFPATFVGTYLGVAFVALGRRSLEGQAVSLQDGFRCANRRLPAILAWSLLASLVGLALQALRELRGGWIATRLAGFLLGLAWAAATFFVVPVIALEDPGAFAAVKRSARLVRERWSEGIAGVVSIGGALVLMAVPVSVLIGIGIGLGSTPARLALVTSGVSVAAVAIAVTTTTGHMFRLVLYRYATTGSASGAFTADELDHAFREGQGSRLRRWFGRG